MASLSGLDKLSGWLVDGAIIGSVERTCLMFTEYFMEVMILLGD